MDRKIFKAVFYKSGLTMFYCPTCGKGFLKVKKDTFHYQETRDSVKAHQHEAWDSEWVDYIYSCLFECTNTACKDTVSGSGVGSVMQDYYYDDEGKTNYEYSDYFRPQYFIPHLKFFKVPKNTPESVVNEINKSFSLLFINPSSSANHIRAALEHLLTHLKIKRFMTANGRRKYLSLHKRIGLLPKKYDHIKDLFFAVKWLGNAGSHSSFEVRLDDVLDSYELMSEVLEDIFSKNRDKVKSLAKKINKRKGPK